MASDHRNKMPKTENSNNPNINNKSTTTTTTTTTTTNWLYLPNTLLLVIIKLLATSYTSIPDLLSFSSVCREWRSHSKSFSHYFFLPPLLLYRQPPTNRRPPFLEIRTLTNNIQDEYSFRSTISTRNLNRNLNRKCIGYSHGCLISAAFVEASCFFDRVMDTVMVANVFSGKQIPSPLLSPFSCRGVHFAVLTSHLYEEDCVLLLCDGHSIYCWDIGRDGKEWSVVETGLLNSLVSLLVVGKKVFGLLSDNSLLIFESCHLESWEEVNLQLSDTGGEGIEEDVGEGIEEDIEASWINSRFLVECDKELLLLHFIELQTNFFNNLMKIHVYRLDLQNRVWVRIQSIGDWCLFKNWMGKSMLACRNPSRWGGISNFLYVARSRTDPLSMLPLNGVAFSCDLLDPTEQPPPIWVFPGKIKSMSLSINFSQGMEHEGISLPRRETNRHHLNHSFNLQSPRF